MPPDAANDVDATVGFRTRIRFFFFGYRIRGFFVIPISDKVEPIGAPGKPGRPGKPINPVTSETPKVLIPRLSNFPDGPGLGLGLGRGLEFETAARIFGLECGTSSATNDNSTSSRSSSDSLT